MIEWFRESDCMQMRVKRPFKRNSFHGTYAGNASPKPEITRLLARDNLYRRGHHWHCSLSRIQRSREYATIYIRLTWLKASCVKFVSRESFRLLLL